MDGQGSNESKLRDVHCVEKITMFRVSPSLAQSSVNAQPAVQRHWKGKERMGESEKQTMRVASGLLSEEREDPHE